MKGDIDYSMYVVSWVPAVPSEVQSMLWRDNCVFHVLVLHVANILIKMLGVLNVCSYQILA